MLRLLLAAILLLALTARAEIIERSLMYSLNDENNTVCEGFIAYDDDLDAAPGVAIVHQWQGLGSTEEQHARDLAARGYVGFALDMYGVGCRGQPCGPDTSRLLRDNPEMLRDRARRGLEVLAEQDFVDPDLLGANGYCFGGTVVLEMARAALPLVGVSSFHGGLLPLLGDSAIPARIAVQVHTGDLDPITENELPTLEQELRDAELSRWGTYNYGNCAHGWTDPNSNAYREREGTEAHDSMFVFYSQIFSGPDPELLSTNSRNATAAVDEGHTAALEERQGGSPLAAAHAELVKAHKEIAALRAAAAAGIEK
jgi:dienelactone hydrolase